MDHTQSEVCLIDMGLTSLEKLNLSEKLINLNLHSNVIKEIGNLTHLIQLKYLDLSSNQIKTISGLDGCVSLQILNLACNQLSRVEGIEKLRKLKSLNLSFNQIFDLSGFKLVKKGSHSLTHIEMFSNKITSLQHAIECLSNCTCLQKLEFRQGMNTNPICGIPAYRANIMAQLPWLKFLDGVDPNGNKIDETSNPSDIPGLEELLDFLDPNVTSKKDSDSSISSGNFENLITPKIDSVLLKFKEKQKPSENEKLLEQELEEEEEVEERNIQIPKSSTIHDNPTLMTNRLETLEKQLNQLTALYSEKQSSQSNEKQQFLQHVRLDDSTTTTEIDEDEIEINKSPQIVKTKENRIPQRKMLVKNKNTRTSIPNSKNDFKEKRKIDVRRRKTNPSKSELSVQNEIVGRQVRSTEDDETYLNLIHEIDVERERRWKAEQATRRLLDSLKSLKETLFEERKIQEAAVTFNAKLKQALQKERETRKEYEETSERVQTENSQMKNKLLEYEDQIKQNKKHTKELKENLHVAEKEKTDSEKFYEKTMKELQQSSGGNKRELEMLKTTTEKQKEQLQQLQELMILREQEHRDVLSNKVNVDGSEVQKLIENEVLKCEARYGELIKQHVQRLEEKSRDYSELEDEFRMALQIEADRYNKLLAAHENTCQDLNALKGTYSELSQKEMKTRTLIADLSSMVKEQKFKISELVRHKQEIQNNLKDQINKLEEELSPLRKIASKFESLQQDKDRMSAHIKGQESVIQGLRSERKLWGQELAQQGASLAQEKGRLDSKVEAQSREIEELKRKTLDQDESLKIKCKLIDDQTDSIRKMKQDLSRMSEENKKIESEETKIREELEEEFKELKQFSKDQEEKIEVLTARKTELKAIIEERNEEIQSIKEEFRALRSQWEERDQIISQFEEKVIKMKKSFDAREAKLHQENQDLQNQKNCINDELSQFKEKYEHENATKEHEFTLKIKRIIAQKDDEVQKAKQKVLQVEEEMRDILTETTTQKKLLEERVNKMSKAFMEIQNDLK